VGLGSDEVIEMPFLFEGTNSGLVAYNPGTVNSLVFGDTIVIPDPFGPSIDGKDGFRVDLEARLGSGVNGLGLDGDGLAVYFADNWDLYHVLLGEVHCGTNISGPPQNEIPWWEATP
ncbi:MAG: protein-arginine deiminase family protein, partial [Myxococcota bacterium]